MNLILLLLLLVVISQINTIISSANDFGGAIFSGGNCTITGCNIINNSHGIYIISGIANINYNRIFNNTNYDLKINTTTNINADFNWWGSNSPNMSKIIGITLANYFVMCVVNLTPLNSNGTVLFNSSFKLNDTGVFDIGKLPFFETYVETNLTTGIIGYFNALQPFTININNLGAIKYTFTTDNEVQTLLGTIKLETNSTIVTPDTIVGQSTTITGVAIDENGNPIANKTFDVTINGIPFTVTSDELGKWQLSYLTTTSGIFNVSVFWTGNTTHNGFTNQTTLTVDKLTTNSTVVAPNTKLGQSTEISGVATDENGNPIANTMITVNINGITSNIQTNGLGHWNLTYTSNTADTFNVIVSWNGNTTDSGFTNQTTLTVDKLTTNSTVVAPNTKVGQSTEISGVATDENGNPIANTMVTVNINGVNYPVETNGLGQWNLVYTPNTTGTFNVVVSWGGNATDSGFTNQITFNVDKLTTSNSTVVVPNTKVGQSINITGVAIDENGDPIANTMFTVNINGSIFSIQTNGLGQWNLVYTPNTTGTFNVVVSWGGNATDSGFTNQITFNVTNASSNSTVINPSILFDKDGYYVNETAKCIITVSNNGPNTAYNVTTKVNIPANCILDKSSIFVSKGTFDPVNNIWYIGDLAPGELVSMSFTEKFTTARDHIISIETTGNNFESSTDSVTILVEETPEPQPEPQPEPKKEQEQSNENNELAKAEMKETGIPVIAILIVLLSSLGLLCRKK